jgi:hypothetical protein
MRTYRVCQAAFVLGLSALLLAGAGLGAQEKGKDKKSIFDAKATELKLKGGKTKYTGEFTDKDAMVKEHYYKVFTVKLEAGKSYKIEQKGDGSDPKFDSFLFLEDADGKNLAMNDDVDGTLDSRIVHKVEKAGTFRIIATTFPPMQTGKFILEISAE